MVKAHFMNKKLIKRKNKKKNKLKQPENYTDKILKNKHLIVYSMYF